MKIRELFEAKQVGLLYHFTSIENLLSILKHNRLNAFLYMPGNRAQVGISFTRNQHFNERKWFSLGGSGHSEHLDCSIQVDGNKLSNNYKFVPYNFAPSTPKYEFDESEEVMITRGHLDNVRNYVTKIILYKKYIFLDDRYGMAQEREKQYVESKLNALLTKLKGYGIPIEIKE